jgi:hypothetical protein
MLTVLSINFVGDWLRDILDTRVQPLTLTSSPVEPGLPRIG